MVTHVGKEMEELAAEFNFSMLVVKLKLIKGCPGGSAVKVPVSTITAIIKSQNTGNSKMNSVLLLFQCKLLHLFFFFGGKNIKK